MTIDPFPYPVPPRRGVHLGVARVSGQSYRSVYRLLVLILILQLLDIGLALLGLVR